MPYKALVRKINSANRNLAKLDVGCIAGEFQGTNVWPYKQEVVPVTEPERRAWPSDRAAAAGAGRWGQQGALGPESGGHHFVEGGTARHLHPGPHSLRFGHLPGHAKHLQGF
jgi:hypothetical protein